MSSRLRYAAVSTVFFIMSLWGHGSMAQPARDAPKIPGTDVQFLPDGQMTNKKIAVYADLVGVNYSATPPSSCSRDIEILKGIYKGVTIYKIRMHREKRLVYSTYVPLCPSGKSSGN